VHDAFSIYRFIHVFRVGANQISGFRTHIITWFCSTVLVVLGRFASLVIQI